MSHFSSRETSKTKPEKRPAEDSDHNRERGGDAASAKEGKRRAAQRARRRVEEQPRSASACRKPAHAGEAPREGVQRSRYSPRARTAFKKERGGVAEQQAGRVQACVRRASASSLRCRWWSHVMGGVGVGGWRSAPGPLRETQ